MTLERRAWAIARLLVLLLFLVSFRAAYWQLIRGRALQPVALDPVAAAREYAELRGDPTPEPGVEEVETGQRAGLTDLPQPVIQRTVHMLSRIERGRIYDRNGNLLAEDRVGDNGVRYRFYTEPSFAHVIGYTSALRTGVYGLEATYNEDLLGINRPDTEIDRLLNRTVRGSDLVLTLDRDIQRAAIAALGDSAGAVVVLDSDTGAVLALASTPIFNPNQINDPEYLAALSNVQPGPLLNRATQALYIPGSTFKTVALIAALDTGQINEETIFDFGQPKIDAQGRTYYAYEVDGGVVPDYNHKEARLNLAMAYGYSANAAFAKIGDDMSPEVMIDYAGRLGFSTENYTRRFPLELPVSVPQLANDVDSIRTNNLLRAVTAIGQGELLSTPINMAMVVESVVNNGTIPVPYMVEEIRDPEGGVVSRQPNQRQVRGIMRARTAQLTKEIMQNMVTMFYTENWIPGTVVGAKTGTAQVSDNQEPHAWFTGFAEREGQGVVIAVMVEHGGGGGRVAAPIFQQLAQAALSP